MPAISQQTHVWAKNDVLDKVAKKYGLSDGGAIWKAPENKGIVKTRGKPEQLQSGDKLVIPINPKDLKQLEAVAKLLGNNVKFAQTKVKLYDRLVTEDNKMTDQVVGEMQKALGKMKSVATMADLAAMFVSLGQILRNVSKIGAKALGSELSELQKVEKMNEHALGEVRQISAELTVLGGGKYLETRQSDDNDGVAIVAQAVGKVLDMTSPSFWANAWMEKVDNGKSWNDAYRSSVGAEITKTISETQAACKERIQRYRHAQEKSQRALAKLQSDLKLVEGKVKELKR